MFPDKVTASLSTPARSRVLQTVPTLDSRTRLRFPWPIELTDRSFYTFRSSSSLFIPFYIRCLPSDERANPVVVFSLYVWSVRVYLKFSWLNGSRAANV